MINRSRMKPALLDHPNLPKQPKAELPSSEIAAKKQPLKPVVPSHYELRKQQKLLAKQAELRTKKRIPPCPREDLNESLLTDSEDGSESSSEGEDEQTSRMSARRRVTGVLKKPETEEQETKKPEISQAPSDTISAEDKFKHYLSLAHNNLPVVVKKGHKQRIRKTRDSLFKIRGLDPRLVPVQRDILRICEQLNYEKFVESFHFLDQLRPVLTKRSCVILGEFTEPDKPRSAEGKRSSLSPRPSGMKSVWKGFWLSVLERFLPSSVMIYPWDRPVLEYLIDVRCTNFSQPLAFTIDFIFAENPFCRNASLSRHFEYSGLEPHICSGSKVLWHENSDVTMTAAGKLKRSFFEYFSPIVTSRSQVADLNEKKQMDRIFLHDFQIANLFRTKLIPYAFSYYQMDLSELYSIIPNDSIHHPVRTAVELNPCCNSTAAQLEELEKDFLAEDGFEVENPLDEKVENDQHTKMALKHLGYRIRRGRAYSRGDVTTSGESSDVSLADVDEEDEQVIVQRAFRGLLETNTLKKQRRHYGVKLDELRKVAETEMSGDEMADLLDLHSESDNSYDSNFSLCAGRRFTGRKTVVKKKSSQLVTQNKKKPLK